jgi:long-chain acyl-CoA synthetase
VKGTVPAAAVVRAPDSTLAEAELLAWAQARLASYKAPRHVRFVDAIPLSSSLKPQRALVAEQLRAELAGGDAAARAHAS